MSDEFREREGLRDRFIRAVYDLRDPDTGRATANAIMRRMGLGPEDLDDQARYADIAQHFDMIDYIGGQSGGFSIVSMSDLGIRYVELEGDLRREEGLE